MNIIRDTREKKGWDFAFYEDVAIIEQKVDAGDYTTDKLEGKIAIERKYTVAEIANNLGKKTARERFHREFCRMETLEKGYIVCEFNENKVYEFPKGTTLEKIMQSKAKKYGKNFKGVRMNGPYLRKLMAEIEETYDNIEIVFCGNRQNAEAFTYKTLSDWEKKLE